MKQTILIIIFGVALVYGFCATALPFILDQHEKERIGQTEYIAQWKESTQ